MKLLTKILPLFVLTVSICFGQSASVTRNVNLRSDPSTDNPAITKLTPPAQVQLLEPDATNGFYHVQDADGDEGWVWGKNIKIQAAPGPGPQPGDTPVGSISPDWSKPSPQSDSFHGDEGDCGETGDGGDTDTNLRKNRKDLPDSYHAITWDALNTLPYPEGAPRSRANWSAAQLAQITSYEGAALVVEGYLYKLKVESSSPSAKTGGESTNCHARLANDVDWHMPFTAHAQDGEDVAIVVETTPRLRQQHPHWTTQRLLPWTYMKGSNANPSYNGEKMRISGWLMLDPEHQDMINHGQRSTLWEIHPVTKIEVFQGGQWVDLDQLP